MKIAINKCYGGFDLSQKLYERLIELGIPKYNNWKDTPNDDSPFIVPDENSSNKYYSNFTNYNKRTHPLLIQAIEEIGEEESSGMFGKIKIVDIPDDLECKIENYDGLESIHEIHRSW